MYLACKAGQPICMAVVFVWAMDYGNIKGYRCDIHCATIPSGSLKLRSRYQASVVIHHGEVSFCEVMSEQFQCYHDCQQLLVSSAVAAL